MKGQAGARRALEIAAAGGHSILLMGPPGAGKSMLAERLAGLLPPMEITQALETAAVASLAGRFTLFSRHVVQAGHPPAWQSNPLAGGAVPADAPHWSRVPMRVPTRMPTRGLMPGASGSAPRKTLLVTVTLSLAEAR